MYRKAFIAFFALAAVIVFAAFPAKAQVTTANVSGHVSDPKGLAVAGAKVTVSSEDTSFRREAVSSDIGDFSVAEIPVGTYKISIEKQGFSTVVYDNVELVVGQKRTFDVALQIGTSSQTVLVTEAIPLIQTTSSEIQGSVTPTEVRNLPVVDRNFAGLMTLVPGVRPAENFDPTKTRSGNVTVNGSDGRPFTTNGTAADTRNNTH